MSINRTLLRLSAVSAISNFYREPYPTLAGRMVFDSKVEPIENFQVDLAYPTIVVYTDYDKNHVAHRDVDYDSRTMTITFELLMAIMRPVGRAASGNYVMEAPQTDSELESSLDVMEYQLFESLREDSTAANVFQSIAYGMENVVSRRGATTEGGTKIAARQVTYEARVIQELSMPIMPNYVTDFLRELQDSEGMEQVAHTVQSLYRMRREEDEVERIRRTMGWTMETRDALGYPKKNAPITPPIIRWLDQNGNSI